MCALPFSMDDLDTQPLHDQKESPPFLTKLQRRLRSRPSSPPTDSPRLPAPVACGRNSTSGLADEAHPLSYSHEMALRAGCELVRKRSRANSVTSRLGLPYECSMAVLMFRGCPDSDLLSLQLPCQTRDRNRMLFGTTGQSPDKITT